MMEILKYVVLLLGLTGIALGIYGLIGPSLQSRIADRSGRGRSVDDGYDDFEDEDDLDTPYEQLRELIQQRQMGALGRPPASPSPAQQTVMADDEDDYFDEDDYEDGAEDEPNRPSERAPVVRVAASGTDLLAPDDLTEDDVAQEPLLEPVVAEVTAQGGDTDEMLALFAEEERESSTPAILREVVGAVSIAQVADEARSLRDLLAGSRGR